MSDQRARRDLLVLTLAFLLAVAGLAVTARDPVDFENPAKGEQNTSRIELFESRSSTEVGPGIRTAV